MFIVELGGGIYGYSPHKPSNSSECLKSPIRCWGGKETTCLQETIPACNPMAKSEKHTIERKKLDPEGHLRMSPFI